MEHLMFQDRNAFRSWLETNHASSTGEWLLFGKTAALRTLTAEEALEEALCFGWIDGQLQRIDDASYRKRFTPRRTKSIWSEKNRTTAQALAAAGRMAPAGLAAMARAKQDGTWENPSREPVPDEAVATLLAAIGSAEPARTNYLHMSPSVQRTYAAHYREAKKEETRVKRLAQIIARLDDNRGPMG